MGKVRKKPKLVVNRAERVAATPETIAKQRGCIIRKLYEAKLIDGQEQDAALEICRAFTVIVGRLGYRPMDLSRMDRGGSEMPKDVARLWDKYCAWGNDLIKRRHIRPHVVVEWLEMERSLAHKDEVSLLCRALRDWADVRA